MEISIKNFRGVDEKKYSFSEGTNLVSGPTGSGKSTIFEAVKWCIYGTTQGISPKTNNKVTNVKVKLLAEKITFKRQNRAPATFVITEGYVRTDRKGRSKDVVKTFEGAEATKWVVDRYGEKETWLASCYISQFGCNNFFNISNSQRRQVINTIAYGEDDPEIVIDNCDQEIKKVAKSLKEQQLRLEHHESSVDKKRPSRAGTEDSSSVIKADISARVTALDEKRKLDKIYTKEQGRKKEIQNSIERRTAEFAKITADIEGLEDDPTNIALLQKLPEVRTPVLPGFTRSELSELYTKELLALESKKKFKIAGLKYSPTSLDAQKIKYQEYLKKLEDFNKYLPRKKAYDEYIKSRTALVQKISTLKKAVKTPPTKADKPDQVAIFIFNYDDQPIVQAENELKIAEATKDVVECPHCQGHLIIDNGRLVKFSSDTAVDLEKRKNLDELKKKVKALKAAKKTAESEHQKEAAASHAKYNSRVKAHHQYLSDLDKYQHKVKELFIAEESLKDLEVVEEPEVVEKPTKIPEPPHIEYVESTGYDISKIEEQQAFLSSETIREEILAQVTTTRSLKDLLSDHKKLTNGRLLLGKLSSELKTLNKELSKLVASPVEGVDEDAAALEVRRKQYEAVQKYETWKTKRENLKDERKKVASIQEDLERWNKLRGYVTRVHLARLKPVLAQINRMANIFLEPLFVDEPITITLTTQRKTSTSKSRQVFGFEIIFKNVPFDFESLSGGQKMRVSIALSLALGQFRSFPVMMFDECLSSLDHELSRTILKFISRKTKSITLIAEHHMIEGDFDHVTKVGEEDD